MSKAQEVKAGREEQLVVEEIFAKEQQIGFRFRVRTLSIGGSEIATQTIHSSLGDKSPLNKQKHVDFARNMFQEMGNSR